jgi:hypothetical protein
MYKVLHYNEQGFVTGNKIVCSLASITENWGIRFKLFAYGCIVAVVCGTKQPAIWFEPIFKCVHNSQSSTPTGITRPGHFFYETKLLKHFSISQNTTKLHLLRTEFIDVQSNLSLLQLER